MMDSNYPSFRDYLLHCNDFSELELDMITSKMRFENRLKKTFLLRAGEVCDFEVFIIKGLVISYFLSGEGNKVVLSFAKENWWAADMESYHNASESMMFIEFIEDSEFLIMDANVKNDLLKKIPKLEKMFRLLVERHLINYQQRIFASIALSGKEKYELFKNKYPDIIQRVPQHLIASYLGMTPEFLSKIRKERK